MDSETMTMAVETAEKSVGPNQRVPFFSGFQSVNGNEKKIKEMTGVGHKVFSVILSLMSDQSSSSGLCKEDRLMLFLTKLKLGVSHCVLGTIFGVSAATASKSFTSTLNEVYFQTREWIY